MTRGREPTWAETEYAQWVRRRLNELGWKKQHLAKALAEASDGRLNEKSALTTVTRVTARGSEPQDANRELFDQVLGSPEAEAAVEDLKVSDRLATLEAQVERQGKHMVRALGGVTRRLAKIEAALDQIERPQASGDRPATQGSAR